MSDTPRTDALLESWKQSPTVKACLELTRGLERELSALAEDAARWRRHEIQMTPCTCSTMRSLDKLETKRCHRCKQMDAFDAARKAE